jgi:uncharacterized protein YecT (DUF1311 family)
MRPIIWFASVICLVLSSTSHAQESTEAACDALAQAAQSGCLEKLAAAADAELNDVYRRAVIMIGKSDSKNTAEWKTELRKTEQAWIAFRDSDCGALVGYEWGRGSGMGAATERCLLQKTRQRTHDLVDRYINRR